MPKAGSSKPKVVSEDEDQRCVQLNDHTLEQAGQFCSNVVTTSQYTPVTAPVRML